MEMEGFVDYRGRPITRAGTGGWASARFILVEEVVERFAFCGIYSNLITYLTGQLGQSTATAAANVNAWYGVSGMLPFVGGFIGDAYVGRFRMIVVSNVLYTLSLGLLALFNALPFLRPVACTSADLATGSCPQPSQIQSIIFFSLIYIVALAQSGHKPCIQAFGADQFDGSDPVESRLKSSFFNWWYMAMYVGILSGILILNYIQDNVNWVIGFAIPASAMAGSLLVFLLGLKGYRHHVIDEKSPGVQVSMVLKRRWASFTASSKEKVKEPLLDKSKSQEDGELSVDVEPDLPTSDSDITLPDESSIRVLPLLPIWAACLVYAVIFAQPPTLFTKQGTTLDRTIGHTGFQIPPAALQSFMCVTIAVFIPIYDRFLIPIARKFTGNPSGLTSLQRIGSGLFLSMVCMVIAALVEMKRLRIAKDYGLIDNPEALVPMSLWWLVPQYVMFGTAESLTNVGLQEFFYDQVPRGMRSMGLGLYLAIFGIGSFLSSFMISAIDKITTMGGGEGWFSNNLNKAHLDYFYWLLVGLSAVELVVFLYFARSFVYRKSM